MNIKALSKIFKTRGIQASSLSFAISAAGMLPASAWAHGPQIQVGIENGQIVTRSLLTDEPYDGGATPTQRAYEIPMALRNLGDSNDGWYAQPNAAFPFTGPGIATSLGGFATGSVLGLTFTDGLKIWNGLTFIDPGPVQVDAYRGATHTAGAITSDTGPFQSYSFAAIANSADEHKTAFFRILGDGASPNTTSPDGIYLLSLRLISSDLSVSASDPYFFLLNKNGSSEDASAALAYVNTHLVPEPTTLALFGLLGAAILRRLW